MNDALLLIAALALAAGGFAALAFSQKQHWARATRGNAPPSFAVATTLRVLGAALLAASLWACLVRDGPAFGALLWPLALAVGGLLVSASLSRRAKKPEQKY